MRSMINMCPSIRDQCAGRTGDDGLQQRALVPLGVRKRSVGRRALYSASKVPPLNSLMTWLGCGPAAPGTRFQSMVRKGSAQGAVCSRKQQRFHDMFYG